MANDSAPARKTSTSSPGAGTPAEAETGAATPEPHSPLDGLTWGMPAIGASAHRPGGLSAPQLEQFHDGGGDRGEGSNPIRPGSRERRMGHPINDRGHLILDDPLPPGVSDGPEALGPVAPHPRQDDADQTLAEGLGGGSKQWVGSRTDAPDRRTAVQRQSNPAAARVDAHVGAPACDIDAVVE